MKVCPTCRTQYTDETLRFCLQDGAMLAEVRETHTPADELDETPTVVRQMGATPVTSSLDEEVIHRPNTVIRKRRSSAFVPLVAAAVALLLLLVGGAIGIWLYSRSGRSTQPSNIAANVINANGRLPSNVGGNSQPTNSNRQTPAPSPSET